MCLLISPHSDTGLNCTMPCSIVHPTSARVRVQGLGFTMPSSIFHPTSARVQNFRLASVQT
jgi:hypothetical protein